MRSFDIVGFSSKPDTCCNMNTSSGSDCSSSMVEIRTSSSSLVPSSSSLSCPFPSVASCSLESPSVNMTCRVALLDDVQDPADDGELAESPRRSLT